MAKTRGARTFGNIRRLSSGRYQARYTGPDGRWHNGPTTYTAKMDAEGWLANERKLIELQAWSPPAERGRADAETPRLSEYADQWVTQRRLKPRTRQLYRDQLRLHIVPVLGDAQLRAITPATVRSWYAGLGTDYPTRNAQVYGLLHAIMRTAVIDELADANPCRIEDAMHAPRKKTITVLTATELRALANEMPAELKMSVLLAGWCSLRWGELTELRRKDVDLKVGVVRVQRAVTYRAGEFLVSTPKSAAGVRDVSLPPHIVPKLEEHLAEHVGRGREALLFPGKHGHLGDYAYRKVFKPAAARIGYPDLTPHMLRHCGAVLSAHAGATTRELMDRLGHTTPTMALEYQHVARGRDAQIAQRLSDMAGE